MIPVTQTYNPYTDVRYVDMIVTFDVVSETASNRATYVTNGQETISNLWQLNGGETPTGKYATCEDNLVMLDGTWDYLPDTITTEKIGWWGNSVSDNSGEFEINPTLTATLSAEESCVGFTIFTESTNIVEEFKIRTYNGSDEIYTETFSGGSNILVADLPVTDFDKVILEITKTSEPHRRVKILAFRFGITKQWDKDSIVNASITEEADVSGEKLPINELSVVFDNSDGEFDLFRDTKKYIYREAIHNADVTATSKNTICDLADLKNDITDIFKYATCEDNLVMLDGTYDYLPDSDIGGYEIGYVNDTLSGADGVFTTPPTVTYAWNNDINISGLRLYFGAKNYATSITISAYADNVLVNTETFSNNEDVAELDFSVSGINKIVFSFDSVAEENRYLKISEIQMLRYADSWGSYLTKKQKIKVHFVVNGENVFMGENYFFSDLQQMNGGLTAQITAKNYVETLDSQTYENGMHGMTTLDDALKDVLNESGMGIDYYPATLKDRIVSKSSPKDTTKRAAAHYFSQASCATCYINRRGNLTVKSFDVTPYVDILNMDNIYDNDIARMDDYVNMIRLKVRDEYTDPETENIYFGGSGLYYREIENDCVYGNNGVTVANWILQQKSRRVYFEMKTRGNPALELGDTVKIITRDGTVYLAVVYYQNFVFDGGLKCDVKAVVGA